MGVTVLPRYYALKLSRSADDRSFWDFALSNERRPYKTLKKAVYACNKAAGIKVVETVRRKRTSRGRDIWEEVPKSLVKPARIPRKAKPVAQKLQDMPVAKKRGRPRKVK
jgi:hypothetical protein